VRIRPLASPVRAFAISLLLPAARLTAQVASAPDAAGRLAWREQANELGSHLHYDESKVGPLMLNPKIKDSSPSARAAAHSMRPNSDRRKINPT
jgi:hypothetical protein